MADRSRIVWSPRARADLLEIWRYFARVGSMEVADAILFDIERTAKRLLQYPLMGRSRDEFASGLRSVLVHPHVIFYRVSEQGIDVARVLHQRRDLGAVFAPAPEQERQQ